MQCQRGMMWVLPLLALAGLGAGGSRETALIEAAKNGDTTALRASLQQKVDVNATLADGSTALHWAAHRNDVVAVDLLIQAGANVKAANRYRVTPLTLAAENGNASVAERLLKAGADANAASPTGETPLMTAARTGNRETVKLLLAYGAGVNARESTRGQTALMWAAANGNAGAIRVLVENGADLKARSHGPASATNAAPVKAVSGYRDYSRKDRMDAFTPLLFAVYDGHVEAVQALLESGASVNETTETGMSALVLAIINAHWELAGMLLDKGADPNAAGQGWNALHQLARSRTLSIGQFPHPVPTGRMSSSELARKLLLHGADVNARMTKDMKDGFRGRANRIGATPFWLATKGGDLEMMRLFMAHGADVTVKTATNATALMMAAGVDMFYPEEDSGTTEDAEQALQLALQVGAGEVNAVNNRGETALHGAANRESPLMVQLLVDRGAKLDAKNKGGLTPLDICNGSRNGPTTPTAALLRQLMVAQGLPVKEPSAVAEEERGTTRR